MFLHAASLQKDGAALDVEVAFNNWFCREGSSLSSGTHIILMRVGFLSHCFVFVLTKIEMFLIHSSRDLFLFLKYLSVSWF